MGTLNGAQVKELFEREAILIGSEDVVPCRRVAELFGDRAARYASGLKPVNSYQDRYASAWGLGRDTAVPYLTFLGFQYAASWRNVELIHEDETKNAPKEAALA